MPVASDNRGRNRDWSFRSTDPEGGFNPYGWSRSDQARFDGVWTDAGDDLVDALIEDYGVMWPWMCPRRLLTREPALAEEVYELARRRLIGQGHTYADRPDVVYEHAAMYGSFHAARARRSWPDARPQKCPLCATVFTAGQLNPWMVRQFGPARWCKQCCVEARNGNSGAITADEAQQRLTALSTHLAAAPPQDFAQRPVPLDLPDEQRDAIVGAMRTCPPAATVRAALKAGSWVEVLRRTGLVPEAWRPARGTYCVAADGHPCRSLAERTIDDWFTRHGVEHRIEPVWPRHPEHNPHGRRRADWELPDGTYVEYAGLTSDEYVTKIRAKQQLAHEAGIRLVVITPPDLANLSELLGPWGR
ncbi:hypothetical protein [Streptomyces sp. CAI-85]|uniref:hypothetical protein n=1 Tax=Streptomyces sp. CAI-85 TaxID=1472662 RepID=UPI0015873266|nr:hypothetical protein [Streptomyces sp. CAI-85]NUV62732.1 hypothetical protein [Streptomyces sp. CAI-85]